MQERDPFTSEIIGAAIEVHPELGPGLLESVYQLCMEHELKLRGIPHLPQEPLPIVYKGLRLDADLRMDCSSPAGWSSNSRPSRSSIPSTRPS